jgi:hypothetical protein
MAEEVVSLEELALARVLEECLEAMSRGDTDLDALAARHPEAHNEIRPLLGIAALLKAPPLAAQFYDDLKERLLARHGAAVA